MTPSSIKVLFLDIGGVLLTNGWGHESRQAAAERFGYSYSEAEKLHDMTFSIYEEGRISLDDYLDTVLFYTPRSFPRQEYIDFMLQQSQLLSQILPWVIEWKSRHPHVKIFSLNNEPKDLHQYRIKTFGLRDLFDGFVCSCDLGLRKPDPAIYKLAPAVAGVQPGECLYLDDREVLVRAGSKAGLQARQHRSFDETKAFLEGLF